MIPAPEGKGVEQPVSLGVGWGQLYVCWVGMEGDMFTNACPAILPGSQSELHPAPPSFPWKHGSKSKGYNSSQIHPSLPLTPLKNVWDHSLYILQPAEMELSHTCACIPLVWPSLSSKWGFFTLGNGQRRRGNTPHPHSPAPELIISTV